MIEKQEYKLALIGTPETVGLFSTVGIETYGVGESDDGYGVLERLCKSEEYAAIFIQEIIAEKIEENMQELRKKITLPALLIIPGAEASKGIGKRDLKRIIEKAIGSDLPSLQ